MQDNHPSLPSQQVSPRKKQGKLDQEVSTPEYGPFQLTDIPRILYEEFRARDGINEESVRHFDGGDFLRSADIAIANCYLCYGRLRGREYVMLIDEDPQALAVMIMDTMLMSVVVKPSWLGGSGPYGHSYKEKLFAVVRKKSIPLQYAYSRLMAEIQVRAYMLGEVAIETEMFLLKEGEEPFRHCPFYERILFGEND